MATGTGDKPRVITKATAPKTTTRKTTPKITATDKSKPVSKKVEISKKRRPMSTWQPIKPDAEYLAKRRKMMEMYPSIEQIARKIHKFESQDIYNCYLTGLQLLPNMARTPGDPKLCAIICCNADGSDKRKPFVLHQGRPAELDAETESHFETDFSSFYITTAIFTRWLQAFDTDMAAQGRKIAMLYDSYLVKVEPEGAQLKNITMIRVGLFLDKLAEPMESGIATAFKMRYAQRVIDGLDELRKSATAPNEDLIPLQSCWKHIVAAWEKEVTQEKICHCFASCCTVPVDHQKALTKKSKKAGASATGEASDARKELSGNALRQELARVFPSEGHAISKGTHLPMDSFVRACMGRGRVEDFGGLVRASRAAVEDGKE